MDFLRKHYEKILLALVLIGLMGAVGYMLIIIPEKQQKLQDLRETLIKQPAKPLPPMDTRLEDDALLRLKSPFKLDLTARHNLFNPVLWQLRSDGRLQKIDSANKIGPEALLVTAIHPLYMTVTYQSTNDSGFLVKIHKPSAPPRDQDRTLVVHPEPAPNDLLILRHLEGATGNPTALQLEFKDSHLTFTLPLDPDKPYKQVDGYVADLRYSADPGAGPWNNVRKNPSMALALDPRPPLVLEGVDYSVIDVGENYVVVSSKVNRKRTTRFLSSPSQ